MGKALTGELSCPVTGLVVLLAVPKFRHSKSWSNRLCSLLTVIPLFGYNRWCRRSSGNNIEMLFRELLLHRHTTEDVGGVLGTTLKSCSGTPPTSSVRLTCNYIVLNAVEMCMCFGIYDWTAQSYRPCWLRLYSYENIALTTTLIRLIWNKEFCFTNLQSCIWFWFWFLLFFFF